MQRRFGNVTGIGRRIGLNDEKGVLAAVFIALIVTVATVAIYYYWFGPKPESYSSISLLDADGKAVDYPAVLVANQNSTFTVYVQVGNHMNQDLNYEVRAKITQNVPANMPNGLDVTPIDTVDFTVRNGETRQLPLTVTENQVGSYSVVFELWLHNSIGNYVFTGNYCLLPIQVTA
jgi:uncharacterized membrane protein